MSLVTTPTSQLARCSVCSSTRVTEISMTLTDGTPVAFMSCHACEHKTWRDSGHELALDRVLTKAKKHKA